MKSMQDEKGDLLGTTTISFGPGNHKVFDDLKERVTTDVLLSAGFVAVVALYVVMFFGLYYWSQHASVFSPETGSAIMENTPWPD